MKKKLQILLAAIALSLAVTACGQTAQKEDKKEATVQTEEKAEMKAEEKTAEDKMDKVEEKEFTLEELAKYNGKDGSKAYVAVDGVVYDVTDVKAWKEGTHNGAMAGQDLTEAIKKAPHGTAKLEGLPVVGKLVK